MAQCVRTGAPAVGGAATGVIQMVCVPQPGNGGSLCPDIIKRGSAAQVRGFKHRSTITLVPDFSVNGSGLMDGDADGDRGGVTAGEPHPEMVLLFEDPRVIGHGALTVTGRA